jgi:hypothetical protein
MASAWKSAGLESLSKFNRAVNNIAEIKVVAAAATDPDADKDEANAKQENKESSEMDRDSDSDSESVVDNLIDNQEFDDHDVWDEEKASWKVIMSFMPWFVPEYYEILLANHQFRKYQLKFHQRVYILLTDASSWYAEGVF